MNSPYIRTIHLAFEIILAVWFYHGLSNASKACPARQALAIGCLLLQAPLFYMEAGLFMAVIRLFARVVCFTGYLRLSKNLTWSRGGYIAALGALCFTVANNIWVSPLFYAVCEIQLFPTLSSFWNLVFTLCILRYAVVFAVLCLPHYFLPFEDVHTIQMSHIGMLFIIACIVFYIKQSVYVMIFTDGNSYYAVNVWLLFLHIFLLLFLIIMERTFCGNEQRATLVLQETVNAYRIQALKAHQNNVEDVRRLHHDIKNHLLAIDTLAEEQGNQQIRDYIRSLNEGMSAYEKHYSTGRDLLDGLLSEKSHEAAGDDVHFYVDILLPDYFPLKDADLCTVFGNLVDNAIEACQDVEPPRERFLQICGHTHAGRFFITLSNSCSEKKLELCSGLPITTKRAPNAHGFGLKNARRTVEKYGGFLTFDHETPDRVTVTISFPVQAEGE